MSPQALEPYLHLERLLRRRLACLQAGDWEGFERLQQPHQQALIDLPEQAPTEAQPLLVELLELGRQLQVALEGQRLELVGELTGETRLRRQAEAYEAELPASFDAQA